jgi:DNA processing protein
MNYPSLASFPILDILRLIRSENVGNITFFQLITRFGTPAKALEAIPDMAASGGRKKPIRICSKPDAERELELIEKYGASCIAYGHANYPKLLHSIYDPPPFITVRGSPIWKDKACLAIVGSRNASANGYHFAQKLAREAGARGIVIVSGLARGIDTGAHKGALDTGTVGVIAGGIDSVYPPENADLYGQLFEKGCVITENPFGMAPHSRSFPARNRIISGISAATLIVEASLKSGSLITARMAAEQGRDVFAVPGSPLDPRCKGTNDLIRNGAIMCESLDDILPHLMRQNDLFQENKPPEFKQFSATEVEMGELAIARKRVLDKLGPTPVLVDELLRQCDISAPALWLALLELELAGRLVRSAGGKVSLRLTDD